MIERIDNHAERAFARMLTQFADRPTHRGIVAAICAQVQQIEDALIVLQFSRNVHEAEGAQLDGIGSIVGQAREGRDDATYRRWVIAAVLVNRKGGELATLIAAVLAIFPGSTVELVEDQPATVRVRVAGEVFSADTGRDVARLLGRARAGGVRLVLEHNVQPAADTFTLNGLPSQSLGDVNNPLAGGRLASAVQA